MASTPSPFKSLKKRLSQSIQSAGATITSLVTTPPVKVLRSAITDGDENRAIAIVQGSVPGVRLPEGFNPSERIVSRSSPSETLLHLASREGMEQLIELFLSMGGNPAFLDSSDKTCLHALCESGEDAEKRARIMRLYLAWRGNCTSSSESCKGDAREEQVSVNQIDVDGCTAIHYAARSGLISIVAALLERGAIVSLVNKDQMTCCEAADVSGKKEVADMIEAALVFQPLDSSLGALDGDLERLERRATQALMMDYYPLMVNAQSFNELSLYDWIARNIGLFVEVTGLQLGQVISILDAADWDIPGSLKRYVDDPIPLLLAAKLDASTQEQKVSPEVSSMCFICGEEMLPPLTLTEARAIVEENSGDISAVLLHSMTCESGHAFCLGCWAGNASVQINEHSASVIPCPGVKCRSCLDDAWSTVMYTRREREVIARKLRNNKIRCVVDRQSSFLWCPIADCGCILMASSQLHDTNASSLEQKVVSPGDKKSTSAAPKISFPQSVVCGKGHAFCAACKGPSHSPSSCEDWRRWLARIQAVVSSVETSDKDGNEIASALWVAANTKRCPKCELPIEKNEGCNHMTCRTCRHEFCWVCMKAWSMHSQDTGGYFQCNRFVSSSEGAAEGAGDGELALRPEGEVRFGFDEEDEAEDRALEGFFGENGSAVREEMRVRLKGQRMERFVHHYTHFRSHDDSVKMESSMFYDAMCRLSKTLLLSLGDLSSDGVKQDYVWLQTNVINPMGAKVIFSQDLSSMSEADIYRAEIETISAHLSLQEQLREREKAIAASSGEGGSRWSWRKLIFGDFAGTPSSPKYSASEEEPYRSSLSAPSPSSTESACADSATGPVPVALSYSYRGDIEDMSNSANEFFIPIGVSIHAADEPSRAWLSEKMRGLDFLQAGFRELLKCRQILKGSFAFGFYFFDDRLKYTVNASVFESKHLRFTQAQAELNSRTETLSDVVARRRLRASRSTIEDATRSARVARLEFESVVHSCARIGEESAAHDRMDSSYRMSRYRSEWNELHANRPGGLFRRTDSFGGRMDRHRRLRYHRGEMSVYENSELGPMLNAEEVDILNRLVNSNLVSSARISSGRPMGFGADALPPAPPAEEVLHPPLPPASSPGYPSPRPSHTPSPRRENRAPIESPGMAPRRIPREELLMHGGNGFDLDSDDPPEDLEPPSPRLPRSSGVSFPASTSAPSGEAMNPALARRRMRQQRRVQSLIDRALSPDEGSTGSSGAYDAMQVGRHAPTEPMMADGSPFNDDEDEDLNMAILLSIQDPRLNDRTVQARASRGAASSPAGVRSGIPTSMEQSGDSHSLTSEQSGKIESLAAMGFSETDSRVALMESNWDLEMAVYSLLNS